MLKFLSLVPGKAWIGLAIVGFATTTFLVWLNGVKRQAAAEAVAAVKIEEVRKATQETLAAKDAELKQLRVSYDSLEHELGIATYQDTQAAREGRRFAGESQDRSVALAEHLRARGDSAGLNGLAALLAAQKQQTAALQSQLTWRARQVSLLEGQVRNVEQQRDAEVSKRLAIERANTELSEQLAVLQRQAHPGFVRATVRDLPKLAIGAALGVGACATVLDCDGGG